MVLKPTEKEDEYFARIEFERKKKIEEEKHKKLAEEEGKDLNLNITTGEVWIKENIDQFLPPWKVWEASSPLFKNDKMPYGFTVTVAQPIWR